MRRTTKSPTVSAIDVASLEVAGCRPLDHRSGAREARAVAGTVPGPLGRVPLHVATHVRADRRERVELPAFVPVGSGLQAVQPYEPPFAGRELVELRALAALEPVAEEVAGDRQVLLEERGGRRPRRYPLRIEEPGPRV